MKRYEILAQISAVRPIYFYDPKATLSPEYGLLIRTFIHHGSMSGQTLPIVPRAEIAICPSGPMGSQISHLFVYVKRKRCG
jgi:hypothetical protein